MWRHVTMVAKFLDHNNKELKQRRRRRFTNGRKKNRETECDCSLTLSSRSSLYTSSMSFPGWCSPRGNGQSLPKITYSCKKTKYTCKVLSSRLLQWENWELEGLFIYFFQCYVCPGTSALRTRTKIVENTTLMGTQARYVINTTNHNLIMAY